jgi:hypothetical protein
MSKDILNEREGRAIMKAVAIGQGDKGFSQAELAKVFKEMHTAKLQGAIFDLVVSGEMLIELGDEGEPRYLTRPNAPILQQQVPECYSCGDEDAGKCPKSQRACGHHCNCSWVHDHCHWCGKEFGENG